MAATRKAKREPKAAGDLSRFGLYVSLNPDQLAPVTRWGTRSLIGARRDQTDHRKIHYFPGQVVAIPAEEYRRFRAEYEDSVKSGHLLRRTEADYLESLKAHEAEQTKLQDEAKKRHEARKKATEEVANAPVNADRSGD